MALPPINPRVEQAEYILGEHEKAVGRDSLVMRRDVALIVAKRLQNARCPCVNGDQGFPAFRLAENGGLAHGAELLIGKSRHAFAARAVENREAPCGFSLAQDFGILIAGLVALAPEA